MEPEERRTVYAQPNRLLLNWLNTHEIRFVEAAAAIDMNPNELRQLATTRLYDRDVCGEQVKLVTRLRKVMHVR